MKTRAGFVSNSSSSSFVLVTTKENHERALAELPPIVRLVVNSIASEVKFLGRECIATGYLSVMDYSPWEDTDIDYDGERPQSKYGGEMGYGEMYGLYTAKAGEVPDECFSWSADG